MLLLDLVNFVVGVVAVDLVSAHHYVLWVEQLSCYFGREVEGAGVVHQFLAVLVEDGETDVLIAHIGEFDEMSQDVTFSLGVGNISLLLAVESLGFVD